MTPGKLFDDEDDIRHEVPRTLPESWRLHRDINLDKPWGPRVAILVVIVAVICLALTIAHFYNYTPPEVVP